MDEARQSKRIVIIAGPNGAGKTTFAREFLPNEANCPNFVNADLIAAGLSPFAPDSAAFKAGRLMLQEITSHVNRGESFAFETTLAGLTCTQKIPVWRSSGYKVELAFLSLPDVEMAIERVVIRVKQGGTMFQKRSSAVALCMVSRILSVTNCWSTAGSYTIILRYRLFSLQKDKINENPGFAFKKFHSGKGTASIVACG